MTLQLIAIACAAWIVPYQAFATVLRVPSEFPSIQSALDATEHGDTVLLDPGRYHEFLEGPSHAFSLFGEFSPDSLNDSLWSVLDPIPPEIGDTLSTFVIDADTARIRNLVITNRPELRQYVWPTRTGGIEYSGPYLSLSKCIFDSVSRAIRGGMEVVLDTCRFHGCWWWCVHPENAVGRVKASSCYFDGTGFWLARSYSNSAYNDCVFVRNGLRGYLLSFYGENIDISRCTFGPCIDTAPPVWGWTLGNCRIEDCEFVGIQRTPILVRIDMNCPGPDGVPMTLTSNVFRDFSAGGIQGLSAIELMCQDNSAGWFGVIEDNVIVNGQGNAPSALHSLGSVQFQGNVMDSLDSGINAHVKAFRMTGGDSLIARDNLFLDNSLSAQGSGMVFDARWNWWDDSSGPFNLSQNPLGEGSEVGNGVEFIPWLTVPPDCTIDTNEVAIEFEDVHLAEAFTLSVYPNPFNATATLSLEVPRVGYYEVNFYDLTGRFVRELFSGRIESRHELKIDAHDLPSGVYFARLMGKEETLAVQKVLLLK